MISVIFLHTVIGKERCVGDFPKVNSLYVEQAWAPGIVSRLGTHGMESWALTGNYGRGTLKYMSDQAQQVSPLHYSILPSRLQSHCQQLSLILLTQ